MASLGSTLRNASAELLAFTKAFETVKNSAGLVAMTAQLKRLTEASREIRKLFSATAGQQRLFDWPQVAPGRGIESAGRGGGRSLALALQTATAATELRAAAAAETGATEAQRDAARTTIRAASTLADAALRQRDASHAFAVSAADIQRAWKQVSRPIVSSVGQIAADALIGGNQRRGFGYAMYQIRLGLERKLVSGMAENLTKGILSISVEPLFKSVMGMGGPIGGIASMLFGGGSQATFAAAVGTFAAAVGTFAATTATSAGISGLNAGTTALGATALGAGAASGGLFGFLKGIPLIGALFEKGGIVPSAAGGWSVPSSLRGGVPSLLHAREMVLPADISEGLQAMIASGGNSGAGDVHLHFYGPTDASGVAAWIAQAVGDNPGPMVRALRGTGFSLA